MTLLNTRWMKWYNPDEVMPLDDYRDHTPGKSCWCKPEETARWDIEHRAMDGREAYEDGILRLN